MIDILDILIVKAWDLSKKKKDDKKEKEDKDEGGMSPCEERTPVPCAGYPRKKK